MRDFLFASGDEALASVLPGSVYNVIKYANPVVGSPSQEEQCYLSTLFQCFSTNNWILISASAKSY